MEMSLRLRSVSRITLIESLVYAERRAGLCHVDGGDIRFQTEICVYLIC
jgi:hypothetical protein